MRFEENKKTMNSYELPENIKKIDDVFGTHEITDDWMSPLICKGDRVLTSLERIKDGDIVMVLGININTASKIRILEGENNEIILNNYVQEI